MSRVAGVFWWMSTVAHLLLKPNVKMQRILARTRLSARMRQSCIAVHIRRGDACFPHQSLLAVGGATSTRKCFTSAQYLDAIVRLSRHYGGTSLTQTQRQNAAYPCSHAPQCKNAAVVYRGAHPVRKYI